MAGEDKRGSVYAVWHETLLEKYVRILDFLLKKIEKLPGYPFMITDMDVVNLRLLAKAFGVNVNGRNLKDRTVFYEILGEVISKAVDKVENVLKPEDPYLRMFYQIKMKRKEVENIGIQNEARD